MINSSASSSSNSLMMMTPMLPAAVAVTAAASTPATAAQASAPVPIVAAEMPIGTTTVTEPPAMDTTKTTPTTTTAAVSRIEKPERNLWREQEMLAVLQIIRERKLIPLLNDKTVRSEAVFRKVEKEMFDRGFCKKNFQQIWTKWKFLKSTYMTSRRAHQIPKIIPLEVYESLDELLSMEFQNDGSMSSYDGGDYDDGVGCGNNVSSGGLLSAGGYDMMNSAAAVSRTGSNDGYLPVISNVQGNVAATSLSSLSSTAAAATLSLTPRNILFNGDVSGGGGVCGGGRNYAAELNGTAMAASTTTTTTTMRKNKFNKNGFRTSSSVSFKNEEDTNGFGMQHPIFGYRLGVVKDEPVDDEYEDSNNTTAEAAADSCIDQATDDPLNSQQFPEIKPEFASPPASPTPTSEESTALEDDHLPLSVPVIQTMDHHPSPDVDAMTAGDDSLLDPEMPRLHRYTPPPYRPTAMALQHNQHHPPPLKQMPFMKIQLPPRPQVNQKHIQQQQQTSIPTQFNSNSKKIPVLTLRKRKKRLNIPDLSEGTQSPAPSSKQSKISDEDDSRESPPETTQIPSVTYGKAMRDMTASLRNIQREMIDDFFRQQMDLAKSEHEFQKQQDAMLLQCFEDQTRLLLDGARRLFMNGGNHQQGVPSMESVGVFVSDE